MTAVIENAVLIILSQSMDFVTEDLFIPANCDSIAKSGDHLLLEYAVFFANGTAGSYIKRPSQLYHVLLEPSHEEFPVAASLKGMCKNSTRKVSWEDPRSVNLLPILLNSNEKLSELDQGISIVLTLLHITEPEDYRIFGSLRASNVSAALDLVENHKGINAVDEWGQTTLMMSVQMKSLDMVASLLNTRMPKVNVNMAKSSGFTAIFYAVEQRTPTILAALLRKGADPNAIVLQEGSKGNTPLHFACMLEQTKHAEMLLEYGAIPDARNEHGLTPLQLLPHDAVRSTKIYFKKMFEDAMNKMAAASLTTTSSELQDEPFIMESREL